MKVKALISALEALACPEAEIVVGPEEGDQIPIEGGILGRIEGKPTVILAPLKLDHVGGF